MTSVSTVAHLADSFLGLPDAHAIVKHLTPKSKVPDTLCDLVATIAIIATIAGDTTEGEAGFRTRSIRGYFLILRCFQKHDLSVTSTILGDCAIASHHEDHYKCTAEKYIGQETSVNITVR